MGGFRQKIKMFAPLFWGLKESPGVISLVSGRWSPGDGMGEDVQLQGFGGSMCDGVPSVDPQTCPTKKTQF